MTSRSTEVLAVLSFVAGFGFGGMMVFLLWTRHLITGASPTGSPRARVLQNNADSTSTSDGVPEEVVEYGARRLMEMARELNRPLDPMEARRQAKAMMLGEELGEPGG
jgi:hypothetical protein